MIRQGTAAGEPKVFYSGEYSAVPSVTFSVLAYFLCSSAHGNEHAHLQFGERTVKFCIVLTAETAQLLYFVKSDFAAGYDIVYPLCCFAYRAAPVGFLKAFSFSANRIKVRIPLLCDIAACPKEKL